MERRLGGCSELPEFARFHNAAYGGDWRGDPVEVRYAAFLDVT